MQNGKLNQGFTLVELMVVMTIISTLIAIAMPRYFQGLERTKETALKQNLKEMRTAIDHYHADKGNYPADLQTLVTARYLRFIPQDPITEKADTWQMLAAPNQANQLVDIASGATTMAHDGSAYNTW